MALRVETAMRIATAEARQLSRLAGLSRLRAELLSLGIRIERIAEVAEAELTNDMSRATRAAKSYAKRWLDNAVGATPRSAAAEANAATRGSVYRIAATESSEAFSAGRTRYLRRVRRVELWRVWDAQLDKRTCPTCSRADGTIVGANESFPLGEPGAVHPFCRCVWLPMTAEEIDDGQVAA